MVDTAKNPNLAPTMSAADAESFDGADVVVILPTLNEREGLSHTLKDIALAPMVSAGWSVRRLVVDGGSTDGTLDVAADWAVPVLKQQSRGKGAAIREALDWLAARKVRYAVVLDADCTYPGGMVPAMVQLLDAGSQLVVGVRQPVTSVRDDPREFVHRLGNRILNLTASQLAGLPILDLCSGFWAVDVRAVPPLKLETDGFEIEAELFTKSYRAGYTVTQIPIAYRERVGVAKLHAIRDGARILLTTIRFGRRELASTFVPPRPSQLRDFLFVAMLHGADEVRLLSDPSRLVEAQIVAQRIRASRPGIRVDVRTIPTDAAERAVLRPAAAGSRSALTIALPALSGGLNGASHAAVLRLPRTGRVVTIKDQLDEPATPLSPSRSAARATMGVGYRLEYDPTRWPALDRVRAVVANTFPSEAAKELAFLGAHGHFGTVSVWRGRERESVDGDIEVESMLKTAKLPTSDAAGVISDEGLP